MFGKVQQRRLDGAELAVQVANGRKGQVRSKTCLTYWFAVDSDDGESCCSFASIHGRPCEHQCRLASALRVDPVLLVAKELTVDYNVRLFSNALPVLPMSTIDVGEDDIGAPVEKIGRGRRRVLRIPGALDRIVLSTANSALSHRSGAVRA